jgi:hypothetical protein
MREDERQLLSKAALQKQIREEAKFSAGSSLIPLSAVTLLAILLTVIVSHITEAPPFFWGFLVIGVLPVWAAVVYLGACTVKAFRLYRRACGEGIVEIVTDRVCALTEEMELHRGGRYAYNDNACILYLESYGRHVINSTLWNILKEGEEVYVAIVHDHTPYVYRIYSVKTHRLMGQ